MPGHYKISQLNFQRLNEIPVAIGMGCRNEGSITEVLLADSNFVKTTLDGAKKSYPEF